MLSEPGQVTHATTAACGRAKCFDDEQANGLMRECGRLRMRTFRRGPRNSGKVPNSGDFFGTIRNSQNKKKKNAIIGERGSTARLTAAQDAASRGQNAQQCS